MEGTRKETGTNPEEKRKVLEGLGMFGAFFAPVFSALKGKEKKKHEKTLRKANRRQPGCKIEIGLMQ